MNLEEAKIACKQADSLWPVGHIENRKQIISELKIAAERMGIQAGVMKDWSDRFYALARSLEKLDAQN